MKQNTFWFFMATILCAFGLFGMVYGVPYVPIGIRIPDLNYDELRARLLNDMGHEMFLPNISLVVFVICATIYSTTKKYRLLIFVLALLNILFVMAIPTLLKIFFPIPMYTMDSGYTLHIVSSLILIILGIGSLSKRDKAEKDRKQNDEDLLDTLEI
jgi:succinate-acetate transporter protein